MHKYFLHGLDQKSHRHTKKIKVIMTCMLDTNARMVIQSKFVHTMRSTYAHMHFSEYMSDGYMNIEECVHICTSMLELYLSLLMTIWKEKSEDRITYLKEYNQTGQ